MVKISARHLLIQFHSAHEYRYIAGEHGLTASNNKLGDFMVSGITPRPAGQSQISVSFDVDASSILNVTALVRHVYDAHCLIIVGV